MQTKKIMTFEGTARELLLAITQREKQKVYEKNLALIGFSIHPIRDSLAIPPSNTERAAALLTN